MTGKRPKEISYRSLSDSKFSIETHIRELEIDVVEPPRVGSYATMICGNCHIRGHRAEGNRGGSCKSPPCQSFISCGQKKKHPEHTEEIRKMKKQLKEVQKETDTVNEVYVPVDVKTNANGNQTTVNFAVSPVRAERRNKRSRSPSSGSSEESESSRKKKRKKKSRHKKSRSKKSRKKHRKNDSFSESEDDRSRSEDTTKANVGNATTDSRKCSLDELATIATAITFQNNGGES